MAASPTKILNSLHTVAFMIMFTAQDIAISNGHTATNIITLMTSLLAALTFLSIAVSLYDNKEFKRWLKWKFGILCLFSSMVALSVTVFQNRRGTLDSLKKILSLFMAQCYVVPDTSKFSSISLAFFITHSSNICCLSIYALQNLTLLCLI